MTMGGRHAPQGWKIAYHIWGIAKMDHGLGVPRISASKSGEILTDDEAWKLLEDHVQRVYFDLDFSDDCASCERFLQPTASTVDGRMHSLMGWDVYSIMARNEEKAPYPDNDEGKALWYERMPRYKKAWEMSKS